MGARGRAAGHRPLVRRRACRAAKRRGPRITLVPLDPRSLRRQDRPPRRSGAGAGPRPRPLRRRRASDLRTAVAGARCRPGTAGALHEDMAVPRLLAAPSRAAHGVRADAHATRPTATADQRADLLATLPVTAADLTLATRSRPTPALRRLPPADPLQPRPAPGHPAGDHQRRHRPHPGSHHHRHHRPRHPRAARRPGPHFFACGTCPRRGTTNNRNAREQQECTRSPGTD